MKFHEIFIEMKIAFHIIFITFQNFKNSKVLTSKSKSFNIIEIKVIYQKNK